MRKINYKSLEVAGVQYGSHGHYYYYYYHDNDLLLLSLLSRSLLSRLHAFEGMPLVWIIVQW